MQQRPEGGYHKKVVGTVVQSVAVIPFTRMSERASMYLQEHDTATIAGQEWKMNGEEYG